MKNGSTTFVVRASWRAAVVGIKERLFKSYFSSTVIEGSERGEQSDGSWQTLFVD